jgi:hypothetical protein
MTKLPAAEAQGLQGEAQIRLARKCKRFFILASPGGSAPNPTSFMGSWKPRDAPDPPRGGPLFRFGLPSNSL